MGRIFYGTSDQAIEIEDRLLAHVQAVVITKLRRGSRSPSPAAPRMARARRCGSTPRSRSASSSTRRRMVDSSGAARAARRGGELEPWARRDRAHGESASARRRDLPRAA
ncbi:DUF7882 family protein [Microbacterium barkeri]